MGISSLSTTSTTVLEGQAVTFYAKISNNSAYDLKGVVKFYNPAIGQIGSDQIASVIHGQSEIHGILMVMILQTIISQSQ
jgi:hypothetical protein